MLLVIARESTATFGSMNTSRWLRVPYEFLFGHLSDERWEVVHHVIRKTGHFVGYGLLGLAWLRAFLLTWLWSFRRQAAVIWRRWSLQMALCCTALIASMDEVHQSYLADRTGQVSDILLDTTGAVVFCSVFALLWTTRKYRNSTFQH